MDYILSQFTVGDECGSTLPDAMYNSAITKLTDEINAIFESAKNAIEIAKKKAHMCIQTAVNQRLHANNMQQKQSVISAAVTTPAQGDNEEEDDDLEDTETDNNSNNMELIIKNNLYRFIPYISDCVKATDLLAFYEPFTPEQTKHLRSIYKQSPSEAAKKAFEEIEKIHNRPNKYRRHLTALDDARYPKVVQILKGELVPFKSRNRAIIRRCAKHIFQRLNTTELLPYLYSKDIISFDDKQQIERTERSESTGIAALHLLDLLPNRHRKWYKCFIECLIESGHEELAETIKECNRSRKQGNKHVKSKTCFPPALSRFNENTAVETSAISDRSQNLLEDFKEMALTCVPIQDKESHDTISSSQESIKCDKTEALEPDKTPSSFINPTVTSLNSGNNCVLNKITLATLSTSSPLPTTLEFISKITSPLPASSLVLAGGSLVSADSSDEQSCVDAATLDPEMRDFTDS